VPAYEEFLPDHRDGLLTVEDSHALVSCCLARRACQSRSLMVQFWMGDLNYRIEMEEDILRAWCDGKKWKMILEKDQVCHRCSVILS